MTLSPAKIAEWRELEANATKGPWWTEPCRGPAGRKHLMSPAGAVAWDCGDEASGIETPDARFIAAAREAVPALIADNEALRAVLREVDGLLAQNRIGDCGKERHTPEPYAESGCTACDLRARLAALLGEKS